MPISHLFLFHSIVLVGGSGGGGEEKIQFVETWHGA